MSNRLLAASQGTHSHCDSGHR